MSLVLCAGHFKRSVASAEAYSLGRSAELAVSQSVKDQMGEHFSLDVYSFIRLFVASLDV